MFTYFRRNNPVLIIAMILHINIIHKYNHTNLMKIFFSYMYYHCMFFSCFSYTLLQSIGPATRCDATHPRWNVLKPLRCIKIACDVLRCIFQHVGNLSPDFGISQLYIVRFSNGFQQNDGHLMYFHVICNGNFSVKYSGL